MKKALLLLTSIFSLGASYAQTSLVLTNTDDNKTVAHTDTVYLTTKPEDAVHTIFDLKNTGNTKNIYKVKRDDVLMNTDASAYFCFAGWCYPSATDESPDYDTLNPGQSASQLPGAYQMLTAYLTENGQMIGKSVVRYTISNINNANDAFVFTIKYNYPKPVGLSSYELNSSIKLYPNPSLNGKLTVDASINYSTITVINAIGQVVVSQSTEGTSGRATEYDLTALSPGIYSVQIHTEKGIATEKLVIAGN